MGCKKCGATVSRPTPEFAVGFGPSPDLRTAEVYFHQRVTIEIDDYGVRSFYPAERIRLTFSLIEALLALYPGCLSFRKVEEKALYDAA